MPELDLIGSADVCEKLDIDRSTLTGWVASGRIEPALTGNGRTGARWFRSEDVDNLRSELIAEAQAKLDRLKAAS